MPALQPKIVPPTGGEKFDVLGTDTRVIVGSKDSGNALFFFEQAGPPGAGVPLHTHSLEDELFYVTEGQVKFTVDGKATTVGPGSTIFGPRHIAHAWEIVGDKRGRVLIGVTPGAGFEAMLREIGRLPAGPPDMGKILAICARAGVTFHG